MLDYLIVGQGLAGSVLAYELLENSKNILVMNDETMNSSSRAAGGLFNPVTGKNLNLTWLQSKIFPTLFEFYVKLENHFGVQLLYQTDLFRPFSNAEQKKHFIRQIERNDIGDDLIEIEEDICYKELKNSGLGGLVTKQAGWIDIPLMLDLLREYFISNDVYTLEKFNFDKLQIFDSHIVYGELKVKKIIFCEGFYATENPLFSWLPYAPVKGETLIANVEGYEIEKIVNQGSWILPIKNKQFRFGATYNWDDLTWQPTPEAREVLEEKINKFLNIPYEVVNQQAGVRPATDDRRPFLGEHPQHKNILIFNGLGTKGVSLAPFFAKQMVDFLEHEKEITPEANISRFYSLYSSENL